MDRNKALEVVDKMLNGSIIPDNEMQQAAEILGLKVGDIQSYAQKLPKISAKPSKLQKQCITFDQLQQEERYRNCRMMF